MNQFVPYGDSALIIRLGDDISPETNAAVRTLYHRIQKENIEGVVALLPSYNELMVQYDPFSVNLQALMNNVRLLQSKTDDLNMPESSLIVIPVVYGGKNGPDLHLVAEHNNLTVEEVIRIHSSTDYLVYMLGFTPGFCYLGGMDQRIAAPRKKNRYPC